ncbi:MAG: hypothetical protein ABSH45_07235 [Bryobacteraceae bacterium]
MEAQIGGWIAGPIIAFRRYIFRDVLPTFGNLDERASQMASHYNRVLAQPAGEYGDDTDIASVAESAEARALSWYEMMASLRQTMLNLLAAGLFHLTEQQLAAFSRDASFSGMPLKDSKMEKVAEWYLAHLHLDFETLPSWAMIDELRLVANAVKHGEGPSERQLRSVRAELFSNPAHAEFYSEVGVSPPTGPVVAPLSGEDLFVSEKLLHMYAQAAESFFAEIAEHFKVRGHDFYPY